MTNGENAGNDSFQEVVRKNCPFCNNPVDKNDPTVWKSVTGWVGGPRKDSMRLRKDTGYYAHDTCVLKEQRGIAPNQASLFDEDAPVPAEVDNDADQLGL